MHALGVVGEKLERHPHRVGGMELAQVAHMHFCGKAGMLAGLHVVQAAAQELEGLVDGAVEQDVVIGHVEMAVVVDPVVLDPHHRGDEGGEEHRFEVDTVEHIRTLCYWSIFRKSGNRFSVRKCDNAKRAAAASTSEPLAEA